MCSKVPLMIHGKVLSTYFQPESSVDTTLEAERILSQRIFILNMICTGTGITIYCLKAGVGQMN